MEGGRCSQCGRVHPGTSKDIAFSLPDIIWDLGPDARQAHLDWSTDVAYLKGKWFKESWFIRGVLELPLQSGAGSFGLGVWASVGKETIGRYREVFSSDGSRLPRAAGKLANKIRGYPSTIDLPLSIQFRTSTERPAFYLDAPSDHPLFSLQERGLTCEECDRLWSAYHPEG